MNLNVRQRNYLLLLLAVLICFIISSFSEYFKPCSRISNFSVQLFQKELSRKEQIANKNLQQLADSVRVDKVSAVKNKDFSGDEISYYVFVGDTLVYWSENRYSITEILPQNIDSVQYLKLKNFDFIARSQRVGNTLLLALIKVKSQFDYENDYLKNEFAKGFYLDKRIRIEKGTDSDKLAIFSVSGDYLFSLDDSQISLTINSIIGIIIGIIGFLLFFFAYLKLEWFFGEQIYILKNFLIGLLGFSLFIVVCLAFGIPNSLFNLELFSSKYFVINDSLSLGHILVITLLLSATIYTFCFKVCYIPIIVSRWRQMCGLIIVQLLSIIFFYFVNWLFFYLLEKTPFTIIFFKWQDIDFFTIVALLLITIWFTSLVLFRFKLVKIIVHYFKLKELLIADTLVASVCILTAAFLDVRVLIIVLCYVFLCIQLDIVCYLRKKHLSYPALMLIIATFSLFVACFSFDSGERKSLEYYETLIENVFNNNLANRDLVAEHILSQLDSAIYSDRNILRYVAVGDVSEARLTRYLSNYYFDRLGNEFDIKTVIFSKNETANGHSHYSEICSKEKSLADTHFFCTNSLQSAYDYLGAFDFVRFNEDTVSIYIEIYRSNKNNYSYPNQLFQASDKQLPMYISIAKYTDSVLQSSIGAFTYPLQFSTLSEENLSSNVFYKKGVLHTIFNKSNGTIVVVSERCLPRGLMFVIYAMYLLSGNLLIVLFCFSRWRSLKRRRANLSMFNRLLRSLMVFFVAGFTLLFLVIGYWYVRQSKKMIEQERYLRVEYIKNILSAEFSDDNVITADRVNSVSTLSDLANTLESDIHLFSLDGELITSSRPIVFLNAFTSTLINPDVYFNNNLFEDIHVSEVIGELHYTSSYSKLCNKNGKPLAYIAIPTFESLLNFREEIFKVMALIVFVYLILILLSVLVCYLLAKMVTFPIKTLENKLKHIHINKKNEKIEYKSEEIDEITRLVEQYNNMVDELAYSSNMLAKTEREQAWKQMARQIAHEIKNPLTPMKLTVQQLQRMKKNHSDNFDTYFDKTAAILIEEIDNLSRISTEFSDFSKMPDIELSQVNLSTCLYSVIELFKNNYSNIKVEFNDLSNEVIILADKTQITQIFNNLLLNATQSMPVEHEGVISVSMYIDGEFVTVAVADNGCGIPNEVKERIFLPNFTTKNKGMGLGLAIVKNLVIMLNGEITFTTNVDKGTTFYIKFPLQVST